MRVGRVGDLEIGFVAEREGRPNYYQVALSVLDEAALRRELRPLELLGDACPKTLLTLDRIGATDQNGIEQRSIVDWLLT